MNLSPWQNLSRSVDAATTREQLAALVDELIERITELVGCPVTLCAQRIDSPSPLAWTVREDPSGFQGELILRMDHYEESDANYNERQEHFVPSLVLHGKSSADLDEELAGHLREVAKCLRTILNHPAQLLVANTSKTSGGSGERRLVPFLLRLQKEFEQQLDFERSMDALTRAFSKFLHSDAGAIMLLGENGELEFSGVFGGGQGLRERTVPVGKGVAGWVAQNSRPVISNDASVDQRFDQNFAREVCYEVRSLMAAPLMVDGECIGIIEVLNPMRVPDRLPVYNFQDLDILAVIASQLSHSIHSRRNRQKRIESARLATVGRIASFLAHDMRGPLQVIHGCGELMSMTGEMKIGSENAGEMLMNVATELTEMTRSLLMFSQDVTVPILEQVGLDSLLAPLQCQWNDLRSNKSVLIVFDVNAPVGHTEPTRVRRIVRNLVNNAIDATREGTCVTCEVQSQNETLIISVADQGEGVPADFLEDTKPGGAKRPQNGHFGLGLAIVKQFVNELGGTFQVAQASQEGSELVVTLPFSAAAT